MTARTSAQDIPSQFEYYRARNLFPSLTPLLETAALAQYEKVRLNLYERHLNLPLVLLKDQHVLELGCGTGDSALVLARMGARLTLVDADSRVWGPLTETFRLHGVEDRVMQRITQSAEDYYPEQRFSLITAEGFLFTCQGREQIARRLAEALAPGGLFSVSYPDELGSFMEFLKKAAFYRGCALRQIKDLFSDAAEETGRALLGGFHAMLPNPRPFRTWLHDCICSPFLVSDYCWSAPAILRAVSSAQIVYYSSSPSILEVDRLGWYKTVIDDRDWNEQALAGYAARAADFVFGFPTRFTDDRAAPGFVAQTRMLLGALSRWYANPHAAPPQPSPSWYAALEASDLPPPLLGALRLFFAAMGAQSWPDFEQAMRHARPVLALWGKSYHYLVARRAHDAPGAERPS